MLYHIAGMSTEVEEIIQIVMMLISIDMGDVIEVASQLNILFFKEYNRLNYYYWLQLKAGHSVANMLATE